MFSAKKVPLGRCLDASSTSLTVCRNSLCCISNGPGSADLLQHTCVSVCLEARSYTVRKQTLAISMTPSGSQSHNIVVESHGYRYPSKARCAEPVRSIIAVWLLFSETSQMHHLGKYLDQVVAPGKRTYLL